MPEQGAPLSIRSMSRIGLVVLFIPLLLLGGLSYLHLNKVINEQVRQDLQDDTQIFERTFVTPHLAELMKQFNTLFQNLEPNNVLLAQQLPAMHQDWKLLSEMRGDVQLLYFGSASDQIHSYPSITPGADYRPTQRPWYQSALANKGKPTWSEPYPQYGRDELVITLSRTLLDEQGEVVGVFAMDTLLGQLSEGMQPQGTNQSGWQALINQSGKIIAHTDMRQLWQPLAKEQWQALMDSPAGIFYDNGNSVYVSWKKLELLDWILLSVMPADKVQASLQEVTRYVSWVSFLAIVLYLVSAWLFSHKLKSMLNNLLAYVRQAWVSPHHLANDKLHPEFHQLYAEIGEASTSYHQANRQANVDGLTEAYNRNYFENRLEFLMAENRQFCLGMFDLDNFKSINDTYGHQAGDGVLKRVAAVCQEVLGELGTLVRYGGEEFVVIFQTDLDTAHRRFELLRKAIEQLTWRERGLRTTFSGGLVAWTGQDRKTLLRETDDGVYQAKHAGKNRICCDTCQMDKQDPLSDNPKIPLSAAS